MKTEQLFRSTLILMVFSLGLFSSCSNKAEKKSSTTEVSKVKAPAMDLNTAAYTGNLAVVKQHIQAGTALDTKEPYGGATPLLTACVFGHTEIAKALIQAGADLSATNNDGATALHVAAFFCRTEIVQVLLANHADKSALNGQGLTALQTMQTPFEEMKPVYEFLGQQLESLGLTLDYSYLEKTRPVIAELLLE